MIFNSKRELTIRFVDEWLCTECWHNPKDKNWEIRFQNQDKTRVCIIVREYDLIYHNSDNHYQLLRDKIATELKYEQKITEHLNEYRGKGYW